MSELDEDILERCKGGDARAWRRLLDRYAPLVYAIARRFGLDATSCDDVAQTVFASLVKSLGSIRDARALAGWLATTTRRECVHLKQGQARRRAREDAAARDRTESDFGPPDLDSIARFAALRRALDELGGRCKELLEMLYLRVRPPEYSEVAAVLGMPVGSIGPTRQRCLAKLAELIGLDGSELLTGS